MPFIYALHWNLCICLSFIFVIIRYSSLSLVCRNGLCVDLYAVDFFSLSLLLSSSVVRLCCCLASHHQRTSGQLALFADWHFLSDFTSTISVDNDKRSRKMQSIDSYCVINPFLSAALHRCQRQYAVLHPTTIRRFLHSLILIIFVNQAQTCLSNIK